ncbi:MAG: demethoxyubiquinone hydroxylase family protein [Elusimicrobiota bacterium]|jgi:bacterioferritin|nr:demethoxyubiquinone hydroxylase family protein [Elusimicrobiota bacterium]
MGKKTQELVKKAGLNVNELIKKLNKAYADEWLAYIQYWTGAQVAQGLMRPNVQSELKEHAAEELAHAQMLSERIIQLGGAPILDPEDYFKQTNCGYDAPKDFDVKALLKQNIAGERCAIAVYNDLLNYTRGKDPVTMHIARHIMQEEQEHEQDLEDLLTDITSK